MNKRPVVCMSSQLTELQNCCIAVAKGIKIYGQTTVGLYTKLQHCVNKAENRLQFCILQFDYRCLDFKINYIIKVIKIMKLFHFV